MGWMKTETAENGAHAILHPGGMFPAVRPAAYCRSLDPGGASVLQAFPIRQAAGILIVHRQKETAGSWI